MALLHNEGQVDERFNAVGIMQDFGWTFDQYLRRPLWIDTIYQLKCKAEAEYQKVKAEEQNSNGE